MKRARAIIVVAMMLAGVPAGAAWAAESGYVALHNNAIHARYPADALLISVARAGNRVVAVGEHGLVIYSDDNGASWKQAVVPVQVTITTVAFATPNIGWAAGAYGVILSTSDGGATWQVQLDGDDVNGLMTQAAAQYAAANPGSADTQRAVRRAQILNQAGPDKPFLSILVNDPQTITVFGGYRLCVRTVDGGKHWADCSLMVGDPISRSLFQAVNTLGGTYLVGEAGDIFFSKLQTNQFQPLPSPAQATLFDILQSKGGALLTFGVAGELFRSTDQGKTWAQIAVADDGADLTGGTVLADGKIIVVGENGGVYVSSDDGQSFATSPLSLGMSLFATTQAGNGDLVFVGANGVRVTQAGAVVPQ